MATAVVQKTGSPWTGASVTIAFGSNVTAGNVFFVPVVNFATGGSVTRPTITKSSGTATIGTPTLETTPVEIADAWADGTQRLSIWRVPITGSGSLTVGVAIGGTGTFFGNAGIAEVSGLAASPFDTTATNSGTSATESSGAVTTAGDGIVICVSTEQSTGNFTYTPSDTVIFSDANGASDLTSISQYRLNTGSGPFTLTAGTGNSWRWAALTGAWKVASGGGGPTLMRRTLHDLGTRAASRMAA